MGIIGAGDPIDLYRLTLSAATAELDFSLESGQSSPVQLQLFDGSGRFLGEWSTGETGTQSLNFGLASLPAGTTVYVGVSAENPTGTGSSCTIYEYQLWISIQIRAGQFNRRHECGGQRPYLGNRARKPLTTGSFDQRIGCTARCQFSGQSAFAC